MATVYDIVKGINQAAANAYDGAHDARFRVDGQDDPIGLKREKGAPLMILESWMGLKFA